MNHKNELLRSLWVILNPKTLNPKPVKSRLRAAASPAHQGRWDLVASGLRDMGP